MFSRVKQGIAGRSKGIQSIRPEDSETRLMRRLSGHRKLSTETEQRAHSFEISRVSIDSCFEESLGSFNSAPSAARSFTGSTVSTADVFGESSISGFRQPSTGYFDRPVVLDLSQGYGSSSPPIVSSPTPQQTPKPLKNISSIASVVNDRSHVSVPSIELNIAQDCETLDIHAKRSVWIAITATVKVSTLDIRRPMTNQVDTSNDFTDLESNVSNSTRNAWTDFACGNITTLRLSFRAVGACRVRDTVGRKTFKDLTVGQQCNLFIRLHVPKVRSKVDEFQPDQDSLFTELESIVGTLQTEILHIEARYRHSILPSDNIVTIKHICRIQRPKIESRWSMVDCGETTDPQAVAQMRLARYVATTFSPAQALEFMNDYLDENTGRIVEIEEIRKSLESKYDQSNHNRNDDSKPSVIVTDIDWNPNARTAQTAEHSSTSPTEPEETQDQPLPPQPTLFDLRHKRQASSISLFSPTTLAPPLISSPKTTIALSMFASQSSNNISSGTKQSPGSQDTARQLWRHIRRTSLSTKQLAELAPNNVESLEAGNETLKEIRRRALANKRSVGAETLKGWKWEESKSNQDHFGEAPWM